MPSSDVSLLVSLPDFIEENPMSNLFAKPELTARRSVSPWVVVWVVFPMLALLASSALAQTPTVPDGGEFQANTFTTDYQLYPRVAVGPASDFVVVWSSDGSYGTDTLGSSIQGQRYSSDGSALGSQFQINTYTFLTQEDPAVAVSAAGGFVVVWDSSSSSGSDTDSTSVQGQRYASDGSALGGEFQVNTYTTSSQRRAVVAMGVGGDFVVAWQSSGSSGSDTAGESVQGQRYASDGSPLGGEFQVNTYTTGFQADPAVAVGLNGDVVVVWESDGSGGSDTSSDSVQGQRYASDGSSIGGQFQVNTYTSYGQSAPQVGVGSDGSFVVVWESFGSSGNDDSVSSVQGQRFASDGSAVGGEFQVNSYTSGAQGEPVVAVDEAGDFVVVWESVASSGNDTSESSILGQRYASDGSAVGGEFQINSYTTSYQDNPSVSTDAAGNFVVAWLSYGSGDTDTSGPSIHGQRFRVTADIGDKVFLDADFDARQDPSEAGAAGVDVHLRTDLGDLVTSTVTDGDGGFLFQPKIALAGVADEFYVEFEAPPGFAFTAPNVGTDDAIDSDADPSSGQTATFEVTSAGEVFTDIDAGLISDAAVIGDRVWYDADHDGLQQVDELGFAGVTVRLLDDEDRVVSITTTNADGLFGFGAVASGTYVLEVVVPEGRALVEQDLGADDEIDSDFDPLTQRSDAFVYTAGTISRSHDAGLRSVPIFEDDFESGDKSAWSSSTP